MKTQAKAQRSETLSVDNRPFVVKTAVSLESQRSSCYCFLRYIYLRKKVACRAGCKLVKTPFSHFAGLTLVSAPHLAGSYQHLFPLPQFTERDLSAIEDNQNIR